MWPEKNLEKTVFFLRGIDAAQRAESIPHFVGVFEIFWGGRLGVEVLTPQNLRIPRVDI